MQLAARALMRPLVELGATLRTHFDVIACRPALAAGRFVADRPATGLVEDEITM
jgi:hypothetical protein